MSYPKILLTVIGECSAPACERPIYAETLTRTAKDFWLCLDCDEQHGARLLALAIEAHGIRPQIARLFNKSAGRFPNCTEPCCLRSAINRDDPPQDLVI